MTPVAGFPARPPVRPPTPNPDLEETPMTDPAPREYRVDPGSATRAALHYRDERDALLDRVLYLGGIVQAACDELGIHHDTSEAEVVAAIRALRDPAAAPSRSESVSPFRAMVNPRLAREGQGPADE